MTRKHKSIIAAAILAVFVSLFATTAFTQSSQTPSKGVSDISTYLSEISEGINGIDTSLSEVNEGVNGIDESVTSIDGRLEFRLERLETILDAMKVAMIAGIKAMLRLSDDIGEMADRIGEMADRIVATMELMSETLLQISETMLELADCNSSTGSKDTLLLSPSEGETLSTATFFQLYGDYNDFILYVSNDADMVKTTNILVQGNSLHTALARIKEYAINQKIYVAVKGVDSGAVGNLSNTVMLYVP